MPSGADIKAAVSDVGGQKMLTPDGGGAAGVAAREGDEAAEAASQSASKVTTPNSAARAAAQGEHRDPLTGEVIKTTDPLTADHIFPKKLVEELPGFDRLTKEQKSSVLNNLANIQ